jgi:hypothetical protein
MKTQKTLVVIVLAGFLTLPALADHHKKKEKRHHHAHVHGEGKVSIALDSDSKGAVHVEIPGDSIVGFEHDAKTEKDKKAVAAALKKFEEKIGQMVIFDAAAGCVFTKEKLGFEKEEDEENHNELHGEFSFVCKKPIAGTKAKFGFTKQFSHLKTVEVTVLGEKNQEGKDIKNDKGDVQL